MTKSEYMRSCALKGSSIDVEASHSLRRILAQSRGIGANLNQAGHRANLELCKQCPDPTVVQAQQASIAGMQSDVCEMKDAVIAALKRMESGTASPASPPAQPSHSAPAEERSA